VNTWIGLFLPVSLVLARTSGFFAVLPIFGWRSLPMRVRVAIALLVTLFFAMNTPVDLPAGEVHWVTAGLLLARELLCGIALGMAANFVFLAAQQGGRMAAMQMGFAEAFPVGSTPSTGQMVEGVVGAGSAMLLFALKLASPVLAAFLILAVVLAILARVLPEMNILLTSFPLRVGMGLFMAAAIMPTMNSFAGELAAWMNRYLIA